MLRKKGFTLVELLVVIAIISILAAIVVPRVTDYIAKARAARALSEIKGADLACTQMLAASGKQSFAHFFDLTEDNPCLVADPYNFAVAAEIYSQVFYELLRRGRDADLTGTGIMVGLKDEVRRKLGTSYMDLGKDAWGTHTYKFFIGPWKIRDSFGAAIDIYFRSYRAPESDFEIEEGTYIYNSDAKGRADAEIRGNPAADDLTGFPAPKDMPIYILALGADEMGNQGGDSVEHNGGDDVNNWDNASGWEANY